MAARALVTFVTVDGSGAIKGVQQSCGPIAPAPVGRRHVRVPDTWWGEVFKNPTRIYELDERGVKGSPRDDEIDGDRRLVFSRARPVPAET